MTKLLKLDSTSWQLKDERQKENFGENTNHKPQIDRF